MAASVFDQWLQEHNELSDKKCPLDVLLKSDPKISCHWLCVFVSEVKKTDGEDYTTRSRTQILAGLQHFMNEKRSVDDHIRNCDPANIEYKELHQVFIYVQHCHQNLMNIIMWFI